jgi:hypothetical protein
MAAPEAGFPVAAGIESTEVGTDSKYVYISIPTHISTGIAGGAPAGPALLTGDSAVEADINFVVLRAKTGEDKR